MAALIQRDSFTTGASLWDLFFFMITSFLGLLDIYIYIGGEVIITNYHCFSPFFAPCWTQISPTKDSRARRGWCCFSVSNPFGWVYRVVVWWWWPAAVGWLITIGIGDNVWCIVSYFLLLQNFWAIINSVFWTSYTLQLKGERMTSK